MLKHTSCIFILILTLLYPVTTHATVSLDNETKEYLNDLGWSKEDLKHYFYNQGIIVESDFSPKELLEKLGTPINETNLSRLLEQYKLSRQDLDHLLLQVGENVGEYTFIEDLQKAVSYYIEHAEDLAGLSNFLTYLGLTEDEISKLYRHIHSLDPVVLSEELTSLSQQMNQPPAEEASHSIEKDLFTSLNEVLSIYKLTPTYHIDSSLKGVSHSPGNQETLKGKSVKIELFNQAGSRVGDLTLSSEMLTQDYLTQTSQHFLRIGEMKHSIHQLTNEGAPKIRNSNTPYLSLIYGLILLIGSSIYYLLSKNKVTRS